MEVIKAPQSLSTSVGYSIFLAGSIEMGTAVNWQNSVEWGLAPFNGTIYNPRRDDWDSSWIQSIDHPKFYEQVNWELDAMEQAATIAVYFDPMTKAPITLLELGLFTHSKKLVVCCPHGFWRKGNVDIVCRRYGIEQVDTLEALIATLARKLPNYD